MQDGRKKWDHPSHLLLMLVAVAFLSGCLSPRATGPVAQFTWETVSSESGTRLILRADSSRDPNGQTIVEYSWTLGSGERYAGVRLELPLPTLPTIEVTLAVKASDGRMGVCSRVITLQDTGSADKELWEAATKSAIETPTGLTADADVAACRISWSGVPGNLPIEIERRTRSTGLRALFAKWGGWESITTSAGGGEYLDVEAASGKHYEYRARSVSGADRSSWSNSASVQLRDEPTGVEARATGEFAWSEWGYGTYFEVSWGYDIELPPGSKFVIERRFLASPENLLSWEEYGYISCQPPTEVQVEEVPSYKTHTRFVEPLPDPQCVFKSTFRVAAVTPDGRRSAWSQGYDFIPIVIDKPRNLTGKLEGSTQVVLEWEHSGYRAEGFKVFREVKAGEGPWIEPVGADHYELVAVVSGTAREATDASLVESSTHTYVVLAFGSKGQSRFSNAVSVFVPAAETLDSEARVPPMTFRQTGPDCVRIQYELAGISDGGVRIWVEYGQDWMLASRSATNHHSQPGEYFLDVNGLEPNVLYSFRLAIETPDTTAMGDPRGFQIEAYVKLDLCIHSSSREGPCLSGVYVSGTDGAGNGFGFETDSSGYISIVGVPGIWSFSASKSGYETSTWDQSIATDGTRDAWLVPEQDVQPPQPADVTLTLYVHDGSASGPVIQGARVQGTDADGSSFNEYTNSSGYVTITGAPGTWSFTASKSGYNNNSWSQSITSTTTKHAYLLR